MKVPPILKNPVLYQAIGTILGGGVVYFVGYRHGKSVMREQAIAAFEAHEAAQAMVVPASRVVDDEEAAWEELARLKDQVGEPVFEELVEVVKANAQMDEAVPSDNVRSIFSPHSDWVWEDEMKVRDGNAGPYTITREEYEEESDLDYVQITATWYEGDETLIMDEGLEPIFNWHDRVGDLQFGHGSGDPNVVYIRNPDERLEWEIMRDPGSSKEEVFGLVPEDQME